MTADDRTLLTALNHLGHTLGPFTGDILTNTVSVDEQLNFSYHLIAVAGRIRTRVERQSVDQQSVEQDHHIQAVPAPQARHSDSPARHGDAQ